MGTYIAPFDFKTIFLNYFLGSAQLFIFAFVILISYACAKYNMSNKLYLTVLAICSLLFAGYMGEAVYILIILVIGFVSFKSIARIIT